ncbi:Rieske (2Fe-2S) protein [Parahaliea maris]|uniref:Rieske (2Fe-2S) protein n=1 Tax=Parahaliea maris TaxID=2716870 RepID=UPI001F29D8D2|nr:Rieske (2Fe-2S) protein [Parahaliea maris]
MHLCALRDIPDGHSRGFDPRGGGRDYLFVVRRGRQIYAWRNACPHPGYEGASMPWRKHEYLDSERTHIVCAGHGALFDVESGECTMGPCRGLGLKALNVRLEGDEQLYWYPDAGVEEQ